MKLTRSILTLGLLFVLIGAPALPAHAENDAATAAKAQASFDVLEGTWVRPDGGYTITIRGVSKEGTLDASYANPRPLPFSKASASRSAGAIRVFLELTAGGYNGSTYTLTHDPADDRLVGTYYQAVAKQSYEIFFERRSPKPAP